MSQIHLIQSSPCRIVSKKSGKVLALSTDNQTYGIAILKQRRQQETQLFRLINKGKYYLIQSIFNNHYLSVYGASKKAGTGLVTLQLFNVQSEQFYLKGSDKPNEYFIHTFSNLTIECFQQDDRQGTQIIQWPQSGKDHQRWIIQYV